MCIGQRAVWTDICTQCVTLLTALTAKLGGTDHNSTDPTPITTQPTTTSGM